MAVQIQTTFDVEALKRGFEEWDIDALLDLYADDVEHVQINRDNPPSSPRVRRGKDIFRGMFEHCAAAGVKASVENALASGDRAAATITCAFPGGRKVTANAMFTLRDGRIARELDVEVGDQPA